ncbi:MAG TPA: amylo-alpha-1,6-glucosidase [Bacteroidota bacterium]|nr:amylo-alpha-1,6-glucosidase [Bacteroidota bacterium]
MKQLIAVVSFFAFHFSLFADPPLVDQIGIHVVGQSRQFAYTNKQAGTYYGEVNAQNSGGWQGWYVNAEKIVNDYLLTVDHKTLDRSAATTIVLPYQLVRKYPDGGDERFTFLDSVNAFIVELNFDGSHRFALSLQTATSFAQQEPSESGTTFWKKSNALEDPSVPSWIGLSSAGSGPRSTFVVAAGSSSKEVSEILMNIRQHVGSLIAARRQRMENLLEASAVHSDNEEFNVALMWAKLSLDALIMNQSQSGVPVKGIFAGLPWFDNYWGRDSFISLPGATFVTGDFADARQILLSFARFQQTDSTSANYGRIPNIVTPHSIAYNTADGTPWFIKQLFDYVKYSGDTEILTELFPVVERSIEGTIKFHTDSLFFLTHGDGETWMDAVGPDGPWSPRGNRACDIQALWYNQLLIGSFIADYLTEYHLAARWKAMADSVEKNFNRYFVDRKNGLVYDHLQTDGAPSHEMRPNQLFCLDIVNSEDIREKITKQVTSQLIYPYGVGTLAETDSNFHPFHHDEPLYVQDAAYHNGIVWSWLNGRAIYALTRNDEEDFSYTMTDNMVQQILHRGCVGTLSELLDAIPRPGETLPRLSGAFSQAWSLAEFVESIYQDYLGISVDATAHSIRVNPKLPSQLGNVSFRFRVGDSRIAARYAVEGDSVSVTFVPEILTQPYGVNYLWVFHNGDAAYFNTLLSPAETLSIRHSLTVCSVSSGTRNISPRGESIPWHLKNFSSKKYFEDLRLAKPVFDPNIPALRGPAFPMLTLDDVRKSNPSARIIFQADDTTGDDKGISGTYEYPTNVNFAPGILDITRAEVRCDSSEIYFALQFRNLANPGWHPEYGFQLTLAAIAIHRGDSTGVMQVGENSHFTLDESRKYDRLITVGGGIRITDDQGRVLCEYLPGSEDKRNPIGSVERKSVEFSIPLKYLGKPTPQWKMTILVGAQDDHGGAGVGEFRAVGTSAGEWTGGGKISPTDSNVYDILLLPQ